MKLKEHLTAIGQSQAELAAAVQTSTATVSLIIRHNRWPRRGAAGLKERISAFLKANGTDGNFDETPTAPLSKPNQDKDEEMLLRKSTLTQAARQAFGLVRDPFNDEMASSEDVFATPDIKYVREGMYQTARHGGFIAVVGESGAGKSTLRRDLIERIAREDARVIVIEPYVLAMEDNDIKGKTLKSAHIAEAILEAVAPGVNPKRSPEARFRQIHHALQESHRTGNRHVLVIEEAHAMPLPTLKHLKRFFELEDGFAKLISIILIGQSELAEKLSESNPQIREVVQRCEMITLQPLADGRLQQYLKFKLSRVGVDLAEVMDEAAIDAVSARLTARARTKSGYDTRSLCYPLAVNNLVSAAINQAAELGFSRVSADLVMGV